MPKTNRAVPAIVFAVGVMCVSFGSIFVRLADAPVLVKSAYRMGISSLIVVPCAILFHAGEYRRMPKKDFLLTVLSGLFLSAHFATWMLSLDYTSVASSVVLVNTIPIWVALLGTALGTARPSRTMWACVAMSVTGAAAVGYGDISFDGRALIGDALAVAGAMAASAYIMCGKEVRKKMGLVPYIALCYGSSAVILWGAVLAIGYSVTGYSGVTWGSFAGLALMSQILGHSSYNWALGRFSAGFVGIMLLGEPIGSAILAYFLFGETPTAAKLAGFALILAAIALAARDEK